MLGLTLRQKWEEYRLTINLIPNALKQIEIYIWKRTVKDKIIESIAFLQGIQFE